MAWMKDFLYQSGLTREAEPLCYGRRIYYKDKDLHNPGSDCYKGPKGLFKDQRTVTKQPTPQSGSQARPAAGVRWVGRLVQKSASLWLPPLSLHGASDGGPGTAAGQQGWQ